MSVIKSLYLTKQEKAGGDAQSWFYIKARNEWSQNKLFFFSPLTMR